ncbi:hypothetical protein V1511DRAFT_513417 [Dipodascopsis uninucleata]
MPAAVNSGTVSTGTNNGGQNNSHPPTSGSDSHRHPSSIRGTYRSSNSPSGDGSSQNQQRRNSKPWSNHNNAQNSGPRNYGSNGRQSPNIEVDSPERHMYDRLLFLLIRSIGSSVIITVRSGAKFSGILSSASTHGDVGVSVRFARQIAAPPGEELETDAADTVISTLVVQPKDLLDIKIMELNLAAGPSTTFKTDSDISRNSGEAKQRELQPWMPDTSIPMESLDDLTSSGDTTWDQFAVNEKLFGIQTTFDENLYTTKLDKSHPDYKRREAIAAKVAKEIESSSHGGNIHLAEERGLVVDDSGVDEEDKYSGVARDTPSKSVMGALQSSSSNRYTPPALRHKTVQQQKQQIPQQQQVNVAQTPASQVDSAILASRISATSNQSSQPQSTASKAPLSSAPSPQPRTSQKTSTDTEATSVSTISSIRASHSMQTESPTELGASATVEVSVKAKLSESSDSNVPQTKNKPSLANIATKASNNTQKSKTQKSPEIEEKMLGTFKQFVSGEKERLLQKKQELFRKEKDGRLHDLMAFSQSFKLHTPVPMDLVPILAKDKVKQDEIIQKSAQNAKQVDAKKPLSTSAIAQVNAAKNGNKPVGNLSSRLVGTHSPKKEEGSTVPSPVPSSLQMVGSPKKLNVNAHEFKPNPFAASFTPLYAPGNSPGAPKSASSPISTAKPLSKTASRSSSPIVFFTSKIPSEPRPLVKNFFNPFKRSKEEHGGSDTITLDKAYYFSPVWPFGDNPPHTEIFVVPEQISSQRIYGIPMPGAPIPFSPRNGSVLMPGGQISPSTTGAAQPITSLPSQHYDDSMRTMMPTSPPVASPSMAPQMIPFSPNIMYAQHPYSPQYAYGRPGMPPGFIAGPPPPQQQFIPQPFPGQYMPSQQLPTSQGYASPGRHGQAAIMVPNGSQQGSFNGGYYSQHQVPNMMMRGPIPVSQPGGPTMIAAQGLMAQPLGPPSSSQHRQFDGSPDQSKSFQE